MRLPRRWFNQVVEALLETGAAQAVKYVSANETIQATRIRYAGKVRRRAPIEIRITVGRPNYLARRFIKACRKAGEPFPVKRVQLRYPVRRGKP